MHIVTFFGAAGIFLNAIGIGLPDGDPGSLRAICMALGNACFGVSVYLLSREKPH